MNPFAKMIMIGAPSYDGRLSQKAMFGLINSTKAPNVHVELRTSDCSSLTRSFNILWAMALEGRSRGLTHFAMMHDDIAPEEFWLDKMLAIMEEKKADVLSVIIPQKTSQGLTSTAFDGERGNGWDDHWRIRRLTMKEAFTMEPTFTNPKLLVNTGLMLVDMRKSWVERICFRFEDAILKTPEGEYRPAQITEDYYFSREAKKLGAVLYATREIAAGHIGKSVYPNTHPWGTLEKDELK